MDSSAKMLGKALNDPVKGLTALGKAGVTFSEAQKEQIKTMVAHGDVAGAQAIILGEVEKQVGGVAEATATGGAKMSVAFGEMQESVGKALLPSLQALMPILQKVLTVIAPFAPAIFAVVAAFVVLNAVMAANPFVLIAVAVIALIAGLVLLYQNSRDVQGHRQRGLVIRAVGGGRRVRPDRHRVRHPPRCGHHRARFHP